MDFVSQEFETTEHPGIVRGIKHSDNLNDPECRPEARLVGGAIGTRNATVRVTSKRGCGINSLVEFFIEK